MSDFLTDQELEIEIDTNTQEKLPAFAGRKYPIEYLDSREFERLIYFVFKHEIGQGIHKDVYDTVLLMKGTAERGRDSILRYRGNNVAAVQCKRYADLVTVPELCREIIKFALHAIQDTELITDVADFSYYFIALKGLNEKALVFIKNFNANIVTDKKIEDWTEEVLEENKTIKFKNFSEVKTKLEDLLSKIKFSLITGDDIDKKLKNAKEVVAIFFEVEKVASENMLRKVFSEMVGFKNDEDLEKLRLRLQNIPEDNRMNVGLFSVYGYDKGFYQKIIADRTLFYQVADLTLAISRLFIEYLTETIQKYTLLFISGLPDISPFTKQVVHPYLFNKYALIHHKQMTGEFISNLRAPQGLVSQFQTIAEHKQNLLEMGQRVLDNDFSTYVGDEELLKLKKKLAYSIHAGFKNTKEMSERFDADMIHLLPAIEIIEKYIQKIMPSNATLIIENSSSMNTGADFISILKNAGKFNKK